MMFEMFLKRKRGNKIIAILAMITILSSFIVFPTGVFAQDKHSFNKVSGGKDFSLALNADGTVWSFGSNLFGVLGNGGNGISTSNTPIQVNNLSNIVAIDTGDYHALALKNDGTVWAWGKNNVGQLGTGADKKEMNEPIEIPTLKNIVAISAGSNFSLALDNEGYIWSWGDNASGQLGIGNMMNKFTPVKLSLENVKVISAGYNHALAVLQDGSVWSWGNNGTGQLGYNDHSKSIFILPQKINSLANVDKIEAGVNCSYAIKYDKSVWAWGGNEYGQLGNGANYSTYNPIKIYALNNVAELSAGGSAYNGAFALARKTDGTLWTWGNNAYGQLGNGTRNNSRTPMKVILTGVTSLTAGSNQSLVTKEDGSIWSFGSNEFGKLGIGNEISKLQPTKVTFPPTWSENSVLTANNITENSFVLNWTAAYDDSGINYYLIKIDNSMVYKVYSSITSYKIIGLTPATSYSVKIEAVDHDGVVTSGPSIVVTTLSNQYDGTVPTWPVNTILNINHVSSTGFTVNWPNAIDNDGIAYYHIELYEEANIVAYQNVTNNYFTMNHLQQGQLYTIRVKAVDRAGNSSKVLFGQTRTLADDNHGNPIISFYQVQEGETARVKIYTSDLDQDSITLSLNKAPNFVSLINHTLVIRPISGDAGFYTIELKAIDIHGNVTIQDLPIEVVKGEEKRGIKILSPLDEYESNIFKEGSTIPVKFQLVGNESSDLKARLYIAKVKKEDDDWDDNDAYEFEKIEKGKHPGKSYYDNYFKYDSRTKVFSYNLKTKGMDKGDWVLIIKLNDGTTKKIYITLR